MTSLRDAGPDGLPDPRAAWADVGYAGNSARGAHAGDGRLGLLLLLPFPGTEPAMTLRLVRTIVASVLLWGFPEARTGGPLRLNLPGGIIRAAAVPHGAGIPFRCRYAASDDPGVVGRPAELRLTTAVHFARPIGDVLAAIMALGLAHGLGIANGDHLPALRSLAAQRGIPAVEIA